MKRWLFMAVATAALPVIALACGDDTKASGSSSGTPDSGPTATTTTTSTATATGTTTSPPTDAGPDATPAKRTGCVDRPTDVQRPDQLPCNLIPPGVSL